MTAVLKKIDAHRAPLQQTIPRSSGPPRRLRRQDASATSYFFTGGTVIVIAGSSMVRADALFFGSTMSGALTMGEGEDEGKAGR